MEKSHVFRIPGVEVTTSNRFVFFCGHGVSPSSPDDKTPQVFGAERQA
jgi:hypothetical protein